MLSEADISAALIDDPEGNVSEWEAEFRTDISAFLSEADIGACVDHDRPLELPPRSDISYHAFVDPSGGRHDAFAVAVGHKEGDRTVIDVLRGQPPPFDPKQVVSEYTALAKEYGVRGLVGDNYAAAWVETEFKAAGIKYVRSELPKGRLYIEGLPAFTRRTVALPDHPRLLRELRLLERRTHVGGKDTVDHGRVGSDDYANVVFGVLHLAPQRKQRLRMWTLAGPYAGGPEPIELDPSTGQPIGPNRPGVRFVTVDEATAGAVRGPN